MNATDYLPVITFTADTAVMRRGDLFKLESLRIDWEYARQPVSQPYPHGDICNHAEVLRRLIRIECDRITNAGQFCRIYDIDHAHDVIRIIIAWAESRIASAEYSADDFLAAFPDDHDAAHRAYRSNLFS